jgi:tetratricopeptide (TPR) repeat protein
MAKNNTKFIIALLIISWLALGLCAFLYVTARAQNSKLNNLLFVSQQNTNVLRFDMNDYARLKQENDNLGKSALNYIQWQFVLKQELSLSNAKISSEISKLKDVRKERELPALLYNNLGLGFTMALDFGSAIRAFEQAVSFKSNEPDSYYCLGLLYSVYHNNHKAIKNYTRFLELSPKSPRAADVRERIKALEGGAELKGELKGHNAELKGHNAELKGHNA